MVARAGRRAVLLALALALLVFLATAAWPAPPRATVRLVVGFTRLTYPDLATDVLAARGRGVTPGPDADAPGPGLALALLDELVAQGIVGAAVAEPLRSAMEARDAPRNAAVLFLADLSNGPQALDVPGPGRANTRFHDRFHVWVPVVRDDRLADGTVRRMILQAVPNGWLLPRRAGALPPA